MKNAEYIEKKRHGSPDFPIEYDYLNDKHPRYIMNAHWHKEFEIIRVLKGSIKVYLNSIEYQLESGDILLVESQYLHRAEPNDCIYECIVFDLNMLLRQQNDITQKYISTFLHLSSKINCILLKENNEINKTFTQLFDTLGNKQPYYELKVYSLLYDCFFKLYNGSCISPIDKSPHTHQIEAITLILDWIEKNFTETITLEKLSSISGFNKKYLCRIFKEYTSKTIIGYINELRIENACYEMFVNGKSVTDSAFDSGFNDLSYFCRTFKKYKNTTPNKYKKLAETQNKI